MVVVLVAATSEEEASVVAVLASSRQARRSVVHAEVLQRERVVAELASAYRRSNAQLRAFQTELACCQENRGLFRDRSGNRPIG